MGKILFIIPLIAIMLLAGCSAWENRTPITLGPAQAPTQDVRTTNQDNTVTDYNFPVVTSLAAGFGIKGDSVTIKDLYPGYSSQFQLEIVNGKDSARHFRLSVVPESNLQGWEQLPSTCYTWFKISTPEITLKAGDSCIVPIGIAMPTTDGFASAKKFRCRILVEDIDQTGLIQIAVASKIFIETY